MLTLETHCHTTASPDGRMTPAELVATCRQRGIDRVIVTDHWSIEGALEAQVLDPELVIVGEEVLTDVGELLCAFVTEAIPRRTPYHEAIRELRRQGAFISVSHPFDPRRGHWSMEQLDELAGLVDAIETLNARNPLDGYDWEAAQFAKKYGLPGTAGSDAHTMEELGNATMQVAEFATADDLRRVVGQASFHTRLNEKRTRSAAQWARLKSKFMSRQR